MTLFSILRSSAMRCSVRRSVSPLLFAMLAWVPPLPGQAVQDTTQLKELVVTATRLATPANAVTASVTVISGEELRSRGTRFVQDALREVPGASMVQVG